MLEGHKRSKVRTRHSKLLLWQDAAEGELENTLTGWGVQNPFDKESSSMLHYFSPVSIGSRHMQPESVSGANSRSEKFQTPANFNLSGNRKHSKHLTRINQNTIQQIGNTSRSSKDTDLNFRGFQEALNSINHSETREALQPRQESGPNVYSHRQVLKKEFPKSIYEFGQSKRDLDKINRTNRSPEGDYGRSEANGLNLLPRIKPFLHTNKLLKLQLMKCNVQSKSPRPQRLLSKVRPELLEDRQVFGSSLHYMKSEQY